MRKIRFLMLFAIILSVFMFVAGSADDANEPVLNENEEAVQETEPNDADVVQAEPNETAVAQEEPEEITLEQAWTDANDAFDAESRSWMREGAEQVNIAKAALRTTETELRLLKMIAISEGADETVAAIDKLLQNRVAKVDELLDRAKNSRREEIMRQKEERRKAYEERRRNRQTEQ